jgi:DNA-binding NarL/FixJ family response regulator
VPQSVPLLFWRWDGGKTRVHGVSRRALIGNLEPVARLGMIRVLEDGGLEVVGHDDRPDALVEQARLLQPDAIVLGLELDGSGDLGARVRVAAPEAKLILWPRDEAEMQVFDPGSSAPRLVTTSASDALIRELHTGRSTERRE